MRNKVKIDQIKKKTPPKAYHNSIHNKKIRLDCNFLARNKKKIFKVNKIITLKNENKKIHTLNLSFIDR